MKIKLIILAAIMGVTSTVTSQRQLMSEVYQLETFLKREEKGINFEDVESYSGTPYNHPSYLSGNVYLNNELLATDVALRYNAMADEIEIKESLMIPDSEAKLLTKSPDVYVKIAGDIFVFVPYKGGIENGGYFHVLYEGEKYGLFKKIVKDFKPPKKANTSITNDVPARFIDKPVYYIVTQDGKFYELPSSRNKLLKVFGENKNKVKDFVDDNRLDLSKENDLKRLITYYNTI